MYQRIIQFFEKNPITFNTLVVGFSALIFTRLTSEYFMERYIHRSGEYLWYEFAHTLLFFLCSYVVFTLFFEKVFRVRLKTAATAILFGFLITLLPSVFDYFFPVQGRFYDPAGLWHQFITFFSGTPHVTVTYGAQMEIAAISVALGTLGYLQKKRALRAVWITFTSYVLFFLFGTIASWIGALAQLLNRTSDGFSDVATAQMFISPVHIFSRSVPDIFIAFNMRMSIVFAALALVLITGFFFWRARPKILALLKNMRPAQVIYHFGLLILGGSLALVFTNSRMSFDLFSLLSILLLLTAVFFAWLSSVSVNDLYDQAIDRITNTDRPLIRDAFTEKEYSLLGASFFAASLFLAAVVSPFLALPILGYHTIAWLYSARPLRLKRVPYLATALSACASILILLTGYIFISSEPSIAHIPARILWLLLISYTLSLPLKDLKDVEGDKKDGVHTVPVIFGDHWGRVLIGGGIFLSFMLSVWLLNADTLLWAILFGSLSFWTVTTHPSWKKLPVSNRNLPLLILLYTTLYGIILLISFL